MLLLGLLAPASVYPLFNSSVFWSYYSRAPGQLLSAGYTRDSPRLWSGDTVLTGRGFGDSEAAGEDGQTSGEDDILVLGSLLRTSHGPRRRRGASEAAAPVFRVYEFPGSGRGSGRGSEEGGDQEAAHMQRFRDFLASWPAKTRGAGQPGTSRRDHEAAHSARFRAAQDEASRAASFPAPHCRHACPGPGGDLGPPCCPRPRLPSLGPLVQPSLLENWVTGALELGARHPLILSAANTLLLVGLLHLLGLAWAALWADLPAGEARYIQDPGSEAAEFAEAERVVLAVEAGDWLATLGRHVRARRPRFSPRTSFYCCVYTPAPAAAELLECWPHQTRTIRTEPKFECDSSLKYDISLNMDVENSVDDSDDA